MHVVGPWTGVDTVNTTLVGQSRFDPLFLDGRRQLLDEDAGSQVRLGHVVNTTPNHE